MFALENPGVSSYPTGWTYVSGPIGSMVVSPYPTNSGLAVFAVWRSMFERRMSPLSPLFLEPQAVSGEAGSYFAVLNEGSLNHAPVTGSVN